MMHCGGQKGMNPIEVIDTVKQDYISFLKSSFPIQNRMPRLNYDITQALDDSEQLFKGPYLELTPPYQEGKTIHDLIKGKVLHKDILDIVPKYFAAGANLYSHQDEAIRAIDSGGNICVAAGTGAGKTECFLIPIFDYILKAKEKGVGGGVKAVLMYPMNALVDDQLARLRSLLSNETGQKITFGRYTGLTKEREDEFHEVMRNRGIPIMPNEIGSRERMRKELPDILLTNFSMLQYLLLRPKDETIFADTSEGLWRFLVLDEIHTYRGVQGIEVGMLLRRFMHKVRRLYGNMQAIATSATLSSNQEDEKLLYNFLEDIFNRDFRNNPNKIIRGIPIPPSQNSYYSAPEDERHTISEEHILNFKETFLDIDIDEWGKITSKTASEILESEYWERDAPEWFHKLKKSSGTGLKLLFEVLKRNKTVLDLVDLLSNTENGTLSLDGIVDELEGVTKKETVRRIIRLAAGGRPEAESNPVISARYHFFIRGPQGARICMNVHCSDSSNEPVGADIIEERAHLTAADTCSCGAALFDISLCRGCGQPYVPVYYTLDQPTMLFPYPDPNGLRKKAYIMTVPENESDSEELSNSTKPVGSIKFCYETELGIEFLPEIDEELRFIVTGKARSSSINICPVCGHSGGINEAVTPLNGGGDVAQAIILRALQKAQLESPKTLVFSDSRQGAARFAVLADYIAKDTLANQAIYKIINSTGDNTQKIKNWAEKWKIPEELAEQQLKDLNLLGSDLYAGLSIGMLAKKLQADNDVDLYGLFSGINNPTEKQIEANAKVYRQFCIRQRSRVQLEGLGLVRRKVDLGKLEKEGVTELIDILSPLSVENREDAINIVQALLRTITDSGIVERHNDSFDITNAHPDLMPTAPDQRYVKLDSASKYTDSWLPVKANAHNRRTKLLKKIALRNEAEDVNITSILSQLFKVLTSQDVGVFTFCERKGYIVPYNRLYILQNENSFRCEKCGSITVIPIHDKNGNVICPLEKCTGNMVQSLPGQDYYTNLFTNENPVKINIKEHTAQLGEHAATEIQKSFSSEEQDTNDTNVLSCSTTFEMGVDLGDLSVVFMRNVPPEVANYRQRAGRAGRRSGYESMIFTFARSRSHDAFYYRSPERMICGEVKPPLLKMNNMELSQRHMNAFFLGHYLTFVYHKYGEDIQKRVKQVWNIQEDLNKIPRFFNEWETSDFKGIMNDFESLKNAYGWNVDFKTGLKYFIHSMEGVGQQLVDEKSYLVEQMRVVADNLMTGNVEQGKFLQWLEGSLKRVGNERLIDYLVKQQILPGFAFPIHVITLESLKNDLSLDRDKSIAVYEYAPGNTVVADGYAIKSIGLKKEFNDNREEYIYRICPECGDAQVTKVDALIQGSCRVCGINLQDPVYIHQSRKNKLLIPKGFVSDLSQTPKKAASTIIPQFFIRESFIAFPEEESQVPMKTDYYSVLSSSEAELYYVNAGTNRNKGFKFCRDCRVQVAKENGKHKNAFGSECSCRDFDEGIHLGHKFKTDAVRIRFNNDNIADLPESHDLAFWRSLSYAVIKGATIELQIERRDIGAIVQPYNAGLNSFGQEIIIYDAVPGGAGYCAYFRDSDIFDNILKTSLEIVAECDCDPDSSCYQCLRSYDNAFFHRQLERGRVAEFLTRLLTDAHDTTPAISFENASYYIARALTNKEVDISLAVDAIPNTRPKGATERWGELLNRTGKCQLLLNHEFFTRSYLCRTPNAVFSIALLAYYLKQGDIDIRKVRKDQFPTWNIVINNHSAMQAINLSVPDLADETSMNDWSYNREKVKVAQEEFDKIFQQSTVVTHDELDSLLSNLEQKEYRKGDKFDMRDDLQAFYSNGASIKKAFLNDRYIIDKHHFQSVEEHIKMIEENASILPIILLYTYTPKDYSRKLEQTSNLNSLNRKYESLNAQAILPWDREHPLDHQRYIILKREDGTYSRLSMDPGLDVIDKYKRNNWPKGELFQRSEITYIHDYDISSLPEHVKSFLRQE